MLAREMMPVPFFFLTSTRHQSRASIIVFVARHGSRLRPAPVHLERFHQFCGFRSGRAPDRPAYPPRNPANSYALPPLGRLKIANVTSLSEVSSFPSAHDDQGVETLRSHHPEHRLHNPSGLQHTTAGGLQNQLQETNGTSCNRAQIVDISRR